MRSTSLPPAPARRSRTSSSAKPIVPRSPRLCGCSTVCRSQSNWRPRGCACCRPRRSSSGCAIASGCSPAPAAPPRVRPRSGCDRLVLGAAHAVGAGRAGSVFGVRGRLYARGGRSGARPFALAGASSCDGRGAGACRQESAPHLGTRRAEPLRHRGAVLRHVHQHPRVRGGEARCKQTRGETPAEERHGRYFAGFGTNEALEALSLHGGVKRRRALALELDNLVAACRRAVGRGDGETAVAAYRAAWEVLALQGPFAWVQPWACRCLHWTTSMLRGTPRHS